MDELFDLYQQLILDHNNRPHNFGPLAGATHQADGYNPLCGDQVTVFLKINQTQQLEELRFISQGCAISKASASLMTDCLRGKTVQEADLMLAQFQQLVRGEKNSDHNDMGKLQALAGISEFPMRVKCATLAWHAMHAALSQPIASTAVSKAE